MEFRTIADIENDIVNKQTELDQTTHEIQKSILVNAIAALEVEKKQAEEQQERVETQEAEIEAIILPYDFDELFSEEGHPITNANEIIIEVVKDTKRQANIEKNQALDEQKGGYEAKLKLSTDQHDSLLNDFTNLQDSYRSLDNQFQIKSDALDKSNLDKAQAFLERDDAFNKRDAAFRQLEEANETIRGLKIKLENVPTQPQSFDINPSEKLAQMVKESLAEKVNRGLARWDIPVIPTVDIPFVNEDTRQDEATTETPFQENQAAEIADYQGNTSLEGNQSLDEGLGQTESEVITLESLQAQVNAIKAHVGLVA